MQSLRALHEAGKLDALSEKLLFSPTRPPEELYEWTTDRWQVKNLAGDPAHAQVLADLRGRLDRWMEETQDQGRQPESAKMFDSDMAVYLGGRDRKGEESDTERNIRQMKQWAKEGK